MKHLTFSFELPEQFNDYTDDELTLEYSELIHGIIADTHMKIMDVMASDSTDDTKQHMVEYYKTNIELIKGIRTYNMIDSNRLAAIITETVYDVKKENTTIRMVENEIIDFLNNM